MLFICLFGLKKKLLTEQKLNLYSGFLTGPYDFTQYVLFMIFIKFENRDKTSSKTEQAQKQNKTKQIFWMGNLSDQTFDFLPPRKPGHYMLRRRLMSRMKASLNIINS